MLLLPLTSIAVVVLGACGSGLPPAAEPPRTAAPVEAPSPVAEAPVCPGSVPASVSRSELRAFLDRGIPAFLDGVQVEPVADRAGARFAGHRVVAISRELRCGPLGIREGDIVVAVNGIGVERPEDAQRIWTALSRADSVVVSLIRGGREVDVSVAVEDDPASPGSHGPPQVPR
ncbi:MAG: hypothetical protein QME96_12570 [Myxococcota bacterium]|nr:hypothetical protein [Myxococcota bacterium]